MRVETTRVGRRRAHELTWSSAILAAIIVVLAVSGISAGIAAVSARGSSTSSFIHAQPGSIWWNGHDRLNVLIMSVDAPSGRGAISALTLASFNPATRSAHLLSIPRSLWVTIPGFGQARIGEAYADGGPRLALLVAESVTHIPIPYYMALGEDAFHQLVGSYGGVTIHDPSFSTMRNPSGARRLDGEAVLAYMQTAGGPSADVVDAERQTRVLGGLAHAALQPQALYQLPEIINNDGKSIDTNLPYNQLPALARTLADVPASHVHRATLDYSSGAVADYTANGMHVLLPDWQRIHAMTSQGYADNLRKSGSVEVLNGSGALGAAENLAQWLAQFGLDVARYGSAQRFDYPRTQVVLNTHARGRADAVARAAAAMVQAPIVTRSVPTSTAPVVIIIGVDYQDPSQQ